MMKPSQNFINPKHPTKGENKEQKERPKTKPKNKNSQLGGK
jgi:hypothetical protein